MKKQGRVIPVEGNGGEINFDFKGITIQFLVAVVRKMKRFLH